MSSIDLSVVLTAHAESVIAGPTICSAEAAIAAAERSGWNIERLVSFDAPSKECIGYFQQPKLKAWRHAGTYAFRDQGKTRNAAIEAATGRWVAILDGDDLIAENWLLEATKLLAEAERTGDRIIVHPELNWVFDAGAFVFTKPDQKDPLFTPYYFSITNYYDAMCVAPKSVWREHPYPHRAIKDGFAFEDWQWGIETMAAGWRHVIADNTIVFKRRRDASQTHESRTNSATVRAIEPMAVDRAMALRG